MRYALLLLLILQLPLAYAGGDKIKVLTCEPEWAALAHTIGGDYLEIDSATTYRQDPHHIQARPSLIAKARNADLLICSGAELEVGWLPLLLRKSSNARIQPGQPGYFMATDQVELLERRTQVDRSEGDVHAAGNPHIQMDPRRMLQVAGQLARTLEKLLPEQAAAFADNLQALHKELQAQLQRKAPTLEKLRGKSIVVHHNSWVYLQDWLGLENVAELEPKPGLPPSSVHLATLVELLKHQPARAIVYASYQDPTPARWLSTRTGIPALALPNSVADWRKPDALIDYYDELIERLSSAFDNSTQ